MPKSRIDLIVKSIISSNLNSLCRKRYDRAESEFIEAKLLLFNKMEKKELLTEHLCRIIEANEQRKANKLSELMTKLEMVDQENESFNEQEVFKLILIVINLFVLYFIHRINNIRLIKNVIYYKIF